MSLAVGGVLLLMMAVVGAWPAARLGGNLPVAGRVGHLSLSLALGAAIIGLVQLTLSLLGIPTGLGVVAALALVSLAGWRRGGGAGSAVPGASRQVGAGAALGRPLGAWLLAVALVSTVVSVGLPFSGDGSKFWAPKARDLAQHPALTAPSIADETQLGFHRGYPLLVPVLLAPAFAHSPLDGSAGAKLVLAGLGLSLLGLIASLLAACGRDGRWLAAALLAMPALVIPGVRESLFAGGYADGVDALFLLLLVAVVDRLRRGDSGDGVLLAGLLGAALVSTKLEGAVELTIVGCAWLLAGPRRGRALAGWVVVVALLAMPTLWLHLLVPSDPSISNPALLLDGAVLGGRIVPVAAALGGLLIDTSALGLAPLAIVSCALAARPRWGFGTLLLLGCLAFFALVYLSTTMQVGRHLHTSLHRLALHWLPALALLAARHTGRCADGSHAGTDVDLRAVAAGAAAGAAVGSNDRSNDRGR